MLRRLWNAFTAAVTSPTAVTQERNLAAFVLCRMLLAVGASASLVAIVEKLVSGM